MQKHIPDDLSIPDFLKVANRGKIKVKKSKATVAKEEVAQSNPLDIIENVELREALAAEIKAGRFRTHWLEDPITVAVFQREMNIKTAKRDEARAKLSELREAQLAEKKALRALKPEFGTGIRIVVIVRDPKRKEGSKRTAPWNAMVEFVEANPNMTVKDVFTFTSYKKADFDRDVKLKLIKTDLITNKPVEPVKPPAKVEAPKKETKKPAAKKTAAKRLSVKERKALK